MASTQGSQTTTVTLHWAPESYISPCFTHFRANDATVRLLSKTQVSLHEQKLQYRNLLNKAAADKDEWEKLKQQLEDQLNAIKVRNAEAERLFKKQEETITRQLEDTQKALTTMEGQHRQLKQATSEQLADLKRQVDQLQRACAGLQEEKNRLQDRLKDAELTAAAYQQARQRVAELESGIAATQARARQLIHQLTAQRDAAEQDAVQARELLLDAQRDLVKQDAHRRAAQQKSQLLLLKNHDLRQALELERLINEPLRYTNHATTTTAHVARSLAGPTVEDRSYQPLRGGAATRTTLTSPSRPAAFQGPSSPAAPDAQDDMQGSFTFAPVPRSSSPARVPFPQSSQPSPAHSSQTVQLEFQPRPASAGASTAYSPTTTTVRHMGGDALTRLSRAWATTTKTAGSPHPAFLDNPARFRPVYVPPASASPARPRTAGSPVRHPEPFQLPLSPPARKVSSATPKRSKKQQNAGPGHESSLGQTQKPSPAIVKAYHQARARGVPISPTRGVKAQMSSSSSDTSSTVDYNVQGY